MAAYCAGLLAAADDGGEDIGLASDKELALLATEYLKRQRKHWPDLVKAGLLPEPTPAIIGHMVDDFKHRHRTGLVAVDAINAFLLIVKYLASGYARFSCNNSKPTSVVDQINNILDKAASEKRFIPWQYVFADYAVSGLKTSRIGYTSLKKLLKDQTHRIETLYIDDFTRPSRDENRMVEVGSVRSSSSETLDWRQRRIRSQQSSRGN